MNELARIILTFFGTTNASIAAFLGAVGLVGGVAMTSVQAIKDVTPLRRVYNRWRLGKWLREHVVADGDGASGPPSQSRPALAADPVPAGEKAKPTLRRGAQRFTAELASFSAAGGQEDQPILQRGVTHFQAAIDAVPDARDQVAALRDALLRLAVDGDERALFELDADQMVAQIKAAFASALDAPHRYALLIGLAGAWAEPADLATVLAGPPSVDANVASGDAARMRARYSEARTRVYQQFQRATDALQVSVSFRWKRLLQGSAFLVSLLLVLTILGVGCRDNVCRAQVTTWWSIDIALRVFVTALLAAFFAPLARDAVAAIAKIRRLGA